MSYDIATRVVQKDPARWFSIVERTVGHYPEGGTWSECHGKQTLSVPGASGWSGTLRFKNPEGEYFLVALGVYNSKRWCDIVPDLSASETGVQIHPEYYGGGRSNVPPKQNSEVAKRSQKGTNITVKYYKEDGHNLYVSITINY